MLIDVVHDVKHDLSRHGRVAFRDMVSKRTQVIDCFGRPEDLHVAERLGAGRSLLLPQELTHSLTRSCETPSPRPSDTIAF